MIGWKRFQLGLIHAAVAITLVPINSTLNRIMIEDLGISATLVVLLFSLPYLLSFIQVAIGSFSDQHPWFGYRRTPYILTGLLLCVAGLVMSTRVAALLTTNFWAGLGLGLLTYGAWGMGFNFATVSYFSLASELSGEKDRAKTTAVMFFVMIVSIILTAAGLSRMLQPFSAEQLQRAFLLIAFLALVLGVIGLIGLERRSSGRQPGLVRYNLGVIFKEVYSNRQVALFFFYLILMLAAILGQDVLLEPFAARAFDLPVDATTRITTIWGGFYLLSLAVAGLLEDRLSKIKVSRLASWVAILAFCLIAISGLVRNQYIFYLGVSLLGLATGPATVSNLSLMLDMTVPGKVGLFIGAWGAASAFARLLGSFTTALVRDLSRLAPEGSTYGYVAAFLIEAGFLAASLFMLRQINVGVFKRHATESEYVPAVIERAAVGGES
ncbi:MAG: major facilitator superfamily transporter [Chloroflexi bacterium]|nr:major facilitator superfamily transporter [Chloroflexota bacterium]